MNLAAPKLLLDRYAQISDLGSSVRTLISRSIVPVMGILALEAGLLWFTKHPGMICFVLVSLGTLVVWGAWRSAGLGLPIVPMLALQNLIAYALPIVVSNESVMKYPESELTKAGVEVLVFGCALAAAWRFGIQLIASSNSGCYALQGFDQRKMDRLVTVAFSLIGAATLYAVMRSIGALNTFLSMLPQGSYSILTALVSAISACGFFLGSMILGKGGMSRLQRNSFWLMLGINCYISSTSLLLSGSATFVFSVLVGLFWSTGRVPWRFVVIVGVLLAYLNLGKFEMRGRYWSSQDEEPVSAVTLLETPAYYQEWISASFDALVGAEDTSRQVSMTTLANRGPEAKSGQSLLDRINNLQNVLFVIDAVEHNHIPPVGGSTYALIPPLLLPRIIWPDKPRTHAGQVLLNVHFGRQDLRSTFQTYIAWGLIAEAYGNFGPIMGTALLGAVLGLALAWVERFSANKLLLSLEGFLSFALFIGVANSFEMVASVLVTSLFQSFVPIIVACSPFVEYIAPRGRSETVA